MTEVQAKAITMRILSLMADGCYDKIEVITNGSRLTAAAMRHAIVEYGRTFVAPPMHAATTFDAVQTRDGAWSVWAPLWTKEEGRSDLQVELTISDDGGEGVVELNSIRVP